MSLEHPQLWGGLIDLDLQALAADETEMLWQLLANWTLRFFTPKMAPNPVVVREIPEKTKNS